MRIIIDGYKQPEEIINNELKTIQDEIDYHVHSTGKQPKRVIITPFYLWDYTKVYGDNKTDCVICMSEYRISFKADTTKKFNLSIA